MNAGILTLIILFVFGLGFVCGRLFLFYRPGVKATRVVPQKTIYARDFKGGDIYKAMASRLKRDGFVLSSTAHPEKIKKELAKAANVVPEALVHEMVDSLNNTYKFYLHSN